MGRRNYSDNRNRVYDVIDTERKYKNSKFNNNLRKEKKVNIRELKQQIFEHIAAIKKLLKIQNKIFVSTKEDRKRENIRKAFHLCGIIVPFIILFFSQKVCVTMFLIVLIPVLIADYNNWALICRKVSHLSIILQLFRDQELIKGKLSGFSWLLVGILLSITVFDKELASMSIAVLIVSDASAALIGKNFGKIKMCGSKTLEGTIAFIVFGVMTAYFMKYICNLPAAISLLGVKSGVFNFNPIYVIITIIISAIVELTAKNIDIDDNFAVPISFCLTYKILMILN